MPSFALSVHTEISREQKGVDEVSSEPSLHSELLQGPHAQQGGGEGCAKSLKDGVVVQW